MGLGTPFYLALDVDYRADGSAVAAAVAFDSWTSGEVISIETQRIAQTLPYRPGAFYERELPCLLAVLDRVSELPASIIVDGYVHLGANQRDGLGAHLHRALNDACPVIGVAKTFFAGTPSECEILRGGSQQPLYITSVGLDLGDAKRRIIGMHGHNRIPTLLKTVDRACREG